MVVVIFGLSLVAWKFSKIECAKCWNSLAGRKAALYVSLFAPHTVYVVVSGNCCLRCVLGVATVLKP